MARILNVIIFFLSVASVAQNRIPELVSPEVNADRTVTFRIYAPSASEVLLECDLLQKGSGPMRLTKNESGVWSVTTVALPSEMYLYNFQVDKVRTLDPNNAFVIRDVGNVFGMFFVPGGKADDYLVRDVPHGSVIHVWYDSPSLKTNRRLTVYTPAGYETSKENYPVLYLQHGAGGDEDAWLQLGRTAQILDNLIASKKAKPMLVVMANGNAGQTAAPGESSAPMKKPVFIQPDMFSGNTEKAYPEVVAFIESRFRVKKDKASRALAGLSMGGMHSLVISANNPELFGYVAVFSSAMLWPKEAPGEVYKDFDRKLEAQKKAGYKLYWIGIGTDDFLFEQSNTFRKKLDAMQFKYVYKETAGGHTWSNWRDYLTEFVPLLFR
ncbi:esterase [Flavobacterium silvaticum]|uniref:Esterase n=1 Tax=Flavobacterium silvaticum TaxID=1852020 RepID=A0A972FM80_9FLAO|nr:alpha/beta hydrolase-fold protein [Flavobacterium silvaticum]NMH28308.1 esterase [Flavobacterium silvaticum]